MRNTVIESHNGQLMSKTQHYRKVTKPLLERKRRARMNHYLDELKNLIVETMEAQGEHITKLEKADILEMTVTYLKTKSQFNSNNNNICNQNNTINPEKFRAGYTQAAYEVSKVFASVPGLDVDFGTKLMKHLGYKLKDLPQPQDNLTSTTIAILPSLNNQRRSPSPTMLNNLNRFEFIDKSSQMNLVQEKKENFDDIKYSNKDIIGVTTPPQSPNSIHCRPTVLLSNIKGEINVSENIRKKNTRNNIDKPFVEEENQQGSGDVWRPW